MDDRELIRDDEVFARMNLAERVPRGSLPVRSAVMVRGPPAGNPMSSMMRFHVPSEPSAST